MLGQSFYHLKSLQSVRIRKQPEERRSNKDEVLCVQGVLCQPPKSIIPCGLFNVNHQMRFGNLLCKFTLDWVVSFEHPELWLETVEWGEWNARSRIDVGSSPRYRKTFVLDQQFMGTHPTMTLTDPTHISIVWAFTLLPMEWPDPTQWKRVGY